MNENFELDLPIFHQSWWLDIVCQNGKWSQCVVENKHGFVTGVLTYFTITIFGFKLINMPPLTPFLGIWLKEQELLFSNNKRHFFEKEAITKLLKKIPKNIWYNQIQSYQLENYLPFYWCRYKQTTRYTYVIEKEVLLSSYKITNKSLKKSMKAAGPYYSVISDTNLLSCLQLVELSLKNNKKKISIDKKIFIQLAKEVIRRKQGALYFVIDNDTGNRIATQFLIWDKYSIYCWFHGIDRDNIKRKGASAMLIKTAIEIAQKKQLSLNFCGSMLPGVADFNSSFGAERKPVHQIYKCSNRLLYAIRALLGK